MLFEILERPEILDDMEKKPVELLDRLKIVKVSSEGAPQVNLLNIFDRIFVSAF